MPQNSLKIAEEGMQIRPRAAQERSKTAQGAPSWPRMALTTAQDGPRGPQEESSEIAQKGFQEAPRERPPSREGAGERYAGARPKEGGGPEYTLNGPQLQHWRALRKPPTDYGMA